jgi:hypothetical protein
MEYKIIRNFTDIDTCNRLVDRLDRFYKDQLDLPPDNQCPNSPSFYGIFNDESQLWLPRIEEAVEKKLFPTYTYSRIYTKGEVLPPHVDRDECEFSFTLALRYDKDVWPIYLQTSEGVKEVFLDNGDILIYKGVENIHWRLALENQFHYQGFFHYVDQDGLFAHKKFDGRSTFATTQDAVDELLRRKNVL